MPISFILPSISIIFKVPVMQNMMRLHAIQLPIRILSSLAMILGLPVGAQHPF